MARRFPDRAERRRLFLTARHKYSSIKMRYIYIFYGGEDVEDTILRLNQKRLACLFTLALVFISALAAAVFLFFAISPMVKLGFYWPFFIFVAFAATGFRLYRLYQKKRLDYNADYTENAFALAAKTAFPEGSYSKDPLTSGGFDDFSAFFPVTNAHFKKNLSAAYEGILFDTAFARVDGIFEGRLLRFTFEASFRRTLWARQRGFSPEIKAAECTLGGLSYEKYPAGKTAMDRVFAVFAPAGDEAAAFYDDFIKPLLLDLKENLPSNIKVAAGFHRENLYVLLAAPETLSYGPLFYKVKKEAVKEDAIAGIMPALAFASYLGAEKNLWKKRTPPPAAKK